LWYCLEPALQQWLFQNYWREFTHDLLGLYLTLTNLLKLHFLDAADFILLYKLSRVYTGLVLCIYLSGFFASSVALTGHCVKINISSFCLVFALLLLKAVSIFMGQSFGISWTQLYEMFCLGHCWKAVLLMQSPLSQLNQYYVYMMLSQTHKKTKCRGGRNHLNLGGQTNERNNFFIESLKI